MHIPRFTLLLTGVALLMGAIISISNTKNRGSHRPPTPDETLVYSQLDLSRRELSGVARAVKAGDYDAATRAWGSYLRQRAINSPTPSPRYHKETADDWAAGRMPANPVPPAHVFPDGNIDWNFNATKDAPGITPTPEWQWALNRMGGWVPMAGAYQATKDEKYARAFVSQLRSWIRQCPVPDQNMDGRVPTAWRPLEAGVRMEETWPVAFAAFLQSPQFTDADLVVYSRSVMDHARYLMKYQAEGGNHLAIGLSGLACAGAFFPEFREAKTWRTHAYEQINKHLHTIFVPDGGIVELSPGYGSWAMPKLVSVAKLAKENGYGAELPPEMLASMEKDYDWFARLVTPDRNFPKFNDTSVRINVANLFSLAASVYPERADFRWFATEGKEGQPPAETSTFLDWTGYAVMRSGWGTKDNGLVFRVGPLGFSHWHQDKLNLVLYGYGRELLLDDGGALYDSSKWRAWSVSTASHNCVLIDGLGQNRLPDNYPVASRYGNPDCISQKPIDAGWRSTPAYDFATGVYDQGFGPRQEKIATHRRSVLFVKPDLYIVADTLTPADDKVHAYQARWHLPTSQTHLDSETKVLTSMDRDKPNLAIVPLQTDGLSVASASAQESPELLGWDLHRGAVPQQIPATTLLQNKSGAGVQRFLTLLLPLKAGEALPSFRITAAGQTGADLVFADGRKLAIRVTESGDDIAITDTASGSR